MSIKFKAKFGSTEVEYEGSEEFLKAELPQLLETLSEIFGQSTVDNSSTPAGSDNTNVAPPASSGAIQMTTSNIAAKLGCKTGPDLALAACAHITLVSGREIFSRKDILDDMKSATAYFESNHSRNLSTTLTSMVKADNLIERSKNQFALHATERQHIEETLV